MPILAFLCVCEKLYWQHWQKLEWRYKINGWSIHDSESLMSCLHSVKAKAKVHFSFYQNVRLSFAPGWNQWVWILECLKLDVVILLQTFLLLPILLSLRQVEFVAVISGKVLCSRLSLLFFNQSDGPCEKLSRCPAKQINVAVENQTICLVRELLLPDLSNGLKCSTQRISKMATLTLRVQWVFKQEIAFKCECVVKFPLFSS